MTPILRPSSTDAMAQCAIERGVGLDRKQVARSGRRRMNTCPCCGHRFEGARPSAAMTPKQKELLDFIKLYGTEQGGVSPSYEEMRDYLGLASKSGIHRMVCELEERGLIRRLENRARSIVVVGVAA